MELCINETLEVRAVPDGGVIMQVVVGKVQALQLKKIFQRPRLNDFIVVCSDGREGGELLNAIEVSQLVM